jgi:hypothetical protein
MLRKLGAYATFLGSSNLAKANIYIFWNLGIIWWGQIIVSQLDSFFDYYIDHYIDPCLLICQSSHNIIYLQ